MRPSTLLPLWLGSVGPAHGGTNAVPPPATVRTTAWQNGCWATVEVSTVLRVLGRQLSIGPAATTTPAVRTVKHAAPWAVNSRGDAVPGLPRKPARRRAAITAHNDALAASLDLVPTPSCTQGWWAQDLDACPDVPRSALLAWLEDRADPTPSRFVLGRPTACRVHAD